MLNKHFWFSYAAFTFWIADRTSFGEELGSCWIAFRSLERAPTAYEASSILADYFSLYSLTFISCSRFAKASSLEIGSGSLETPPDDRDV